MKSIFETKKLAIQHMNWEHWETKGAQKTQVACPNAEIKGMAAARTQADGSLPHRSWRAALEDVTCF